MTVVLAAELHGFLRGLLEGHAAARPRDLAIGDFVGFRIAAFGLRGDFLQLLDAIGGGCVRGVRHRVRAAQGAEGADPCLVVTREHHGAQSTKTLHAGFFRSPEYERLSAIGAELRDVLRDGAYVERGKERRDVQTFAEAIEWLMQQAKQGQSIQRYKGLGEMNPEQLWETTMDPAARRLLRVQIEDAIASEEIFSTLMGEQVEPRRAFIESNALGVRNLDV